ncbi:MAG: hypothetical protein NUW01_14940 [Gemmatimonadaceae bacterium]|nr:hypothetical protein [Gemmatimonadaceae bacterium]
MAEQDTAVLEPTETEQVETEAPELLETDEVVDGSPETEGTEEAETEDERLDPEEVEKRVQQAIAEREAEWKAEQEAQVYKYRVSEAEKVLGQTASRGIGNIIAWAVKQVEEGKTAAEVMALVNSQAVSAVAGPLAAAVSTQEYEARIPLTDAFQKKKAPLWNPSVELVHQMERARNSGDPRIVYESQMEYLWQVALETEVPKLVEAALKERDEQAKKAGTVAAKRQETAARAARPGPTTGVGGNGVPARMTLAEIEAMPTSQWLSMPLAKREKLRGDAWDQEAARRKR